MEIQPLWTGPELSTLWGVSCDLALRCTGISLDSRLLSPGDLFFALQGQDPRFHGASSQGRDGQRFAAHALEQGAAAVVVRESLGAGDREIVVPDPFDALWTLARGARHRCSGPVFALTGSSGKTTAKALLTAALQAHFGADAVHATEGSLNNHLGVPLSLARLPRGAAAAVFELGMNRPGEIAPLSQLVAPTVALVLNVLPVHLEGLGSLAAIAEEKLSIAAGLGPEGVLVCPKDRAPERQRVVTFEDRRGRGTSADFTRDDAGVLQGLSAGIDLKPLGAEHRQRSATAILACLHAAGLPLSAAVPAMAAVPAPKGRGSRLEAGGCVLIDESYNANPESLRLALRDLRATSGPGPKLALLADMLELGAEAPAYHAALEAPLSGLDGVFLLGPLMKPLAERLGPKCWGWWPSTEALDLAPILNALSPGAQLLVKGSNRFFWQARTVDRLRDALEARGILVP